MELYGMYKVSHVNVHHQLYLILHLYVNVQMEPYGMRQKKLVNVQLEQYGIQLHQLVNALMGYLMIS